MKCPERFIVVQGEYHILLENQNFEECYKENCAAWDVENKKCRKF